MLMRHGQAEQQDVELRNEKERTANTDLGCNIYTSELTMRKIFGQPYRAERGSGAHLQHRYNSIFVAGINLTLSLTRED